MNRFLPVVGLFFFASHAGAAEPVGLLVTAEDLVSRREDPNVVLLDVRSRDDYAAGHIPRARWGDVSDWKMQSLSEDGLKDAAAWSDRVGKLGLSRDTNVVVYGGKPTDATRIWWTLKYLGLKHVGILNGGFDAWVNAGAPVDRAIVPVEAVSFTPEFQQDRFADIGEMQTILKSKSATVIDTRSDAEFEGTGGPGSRHGHIPGAVHQEWSHFVTDRGRFKSPDEIRKLLKDRGLMPDTKAVTHCQSGGRASLNAFVMELAGYGPVKNYYCGWSEWSSTPNTPVETK